MKRVAAFLLLIAIGLAVPLSAAWAMPKTHRENTRIGENQREAKKAAKQQQKINKKIARTQRKAAKKYQKAQRTAAKQQQRRTK